MSFEHQTVIVTGAGNGIGRGVAEAYAQRGASVVLADIDTINGEKVANHLNNLGGEVIFVPCDVRQESNIIQVMLTAYEKFGSVDVVINNAGISRFKPVFELTVDEWDDVLNTNVRSCFLASREAAKYMKKNKNGGAIVNIASTRALMSEPGSEAYAASKGAIVSITHALAVSLGNEGITVNCISPGWIETGDYSALAESDHRQHPAGRVGKPTDIAEACLYLTHPDNKFVTGANLVIDGGMTRKMIYEP
ncbi:SDR family NAD(P)-dependent oxidoreductase [Paenibacillus segetis]|uniref:SDR family NAD(P)-dependent oxidoreductase n=1 Tax=Paenibacillus segetis TaxID=1325360 RepID=UPI001665C5DE|nr:glucose 1-dehydrogenase [Paenibacillus segetis]